MFVSSNPKASAPHLRSIACLDDEAYPALGRDVDLR